MGRREGRGRRPEGTALEMRGDTDCEEDMGGERSGKGKPKRTTTKSREKRINTN